MKNALIVSSLLVSHLIAGCGASNGPSTIPGRHMQEPQSSSSASSTSKSDIVATATAAGSFKTLAAALTAADLVNTLQSPGPFTVFAPTDEAFAKLPAGTLDTLLKPENKAKLQAILTYHVVAQRVPASEVMTLASAKTVEGKEVKISHEGGKVMVNGANVTKADIECSNGIIHVIDAVLLPD